MAAKSSYNWCQVVDRRSIGFIQSTNLLHAAKNDLGFINRMKLEHVLKGHTGCVNTISWNQSGDKLLSGSDDCTLNIYQPYSHQLLTSIPSGHTANIFSAKFLPNTNDLKIASCAGNGMVRYIELGKDGGYSSNLLRCHSGTTYEVVTLPDDPNVFLTCCEDRKVRLFDLRVKTSCMCQRCEEDILIDCHGPATCMAVNPMQTNHVAVGSNDSIVRIFDRRKLVHNSFQACAAASNSTATDSDAVMILKPAALQGKKLRSTSVNYNRNGDEVLVSFSSDFVYLFSLAKSNSSTAFNINTVDSKASVSQRDSKNRKTNQPPTKRLRLRGDWSDTGPDARPESENTDDERASNTVMRRISNLMASIIDRRLRSGQRQVVGEYDGDMIYDSEAESLFDSENETNNDSSPDDEDSSEHYNDTEDGYIDGQMSQDHQDVTDSPTQSFVSLTVSPPSDDENRQHECRSGHQTPDQENCNASNCSYSTTLVDCEDSQIDSSLPVVDNYDVTEPTDDYSNFSNTETNSGSSLKNRNAVSAPVVTTSIASAGSNVSPNTDANKIKTSMRNITEGSSRNSRYNNDSVSTPLITTKEALSTIKSSDSELKRNRAAMRIQRFFKGLQNRNIDDDIYRPPALMSYRGHRNARTMIKEANFWGDRYILSGSDCGRIFVWDKYTAELVMLLLGDKHVVNCVQPHPFDPILASSGIDHDVKLWSPIGAQVGLTPMASDIVARNAKMLEESQDSITIPLSFMIHLLTSLNDHSS